MFVKFSHSFIGGFRYAALLRPLVIAALFCCLCVSCSVKQMAVNNVIDALSEGGMAFGSDDDPEFIKAAAPFSLKLMESLLAENPNHTGLFLSTSSGFTQYAYAFVQQEADELEDWDLKAATAMHLRARRLYLRATRYGLQGLEVNHPGFEAALRENPISTVDTTILEDVPFLYWTAVSWAGAISVSKDDPYLIAEQPMVEALIDRALKLDEDFDDGAIHNFLITYEMSRQLADGDPAQRARQHFERTLELTGGFSAAPFVSLAESVTVQEQNLSEFRSLLGRALAINPDDKPQWRLVNLIMQRRARWLLYRTDELFLVSQDKRQGS